MACLAGDQDMTKRLMESIGNRGQTPPDSIWGSLKFFEACRAWVSGNGVPPRPFTSLYEGFKPTGPSLVYDNRHRLTDDYEQALNRQIDDETRGAFINGDYAALESLELKYRDTNVVTPSGKPKLISFYAPMYSFISAETQGQADHMLKMVDAYARAFPRSPTPIIFRAILMNQIAWAIRGTGYAPSVNAFQWKAFAKQIDRTRAFLDDNKAVGSKDPYWYVQRINAAIYAQEPVDDILQITREGQAHFPGFMDIREAAMGRFEPKWGGSADAVETFVQLELNDSGSLDSDELYADLYREAQHGEFAHGLFTQSKVNWQRMKKGLEVRVTRYPSTWNWDLLAYEACLVGDHKTMLAAYKAIDQIAGPGFVPVRWPDEYKVCRAWAENPSARLPLLRAADGG
jgi:hypothetical protein